MRYCLIHDPHRIISNEVLRIYELVDGRYQRLSGTWLAGVDLGVVLWPGTWEGIDALWLRWVDKNGQMLPTGKERAEAAERDAAQARLERDAAEQRIAQLEARLRELERPAAP